MAPIGPPTENHWFAVAQTLTCPALENKTALCLQLFPARASKNKEKKIQYGVELAFERGPMEHI